MNLHPYCQFKTPIIAERSKHLCETIAGVLNEMSAYCEERGLPFVVTDSVSTPDEDKALERVSDEHSTARAFDVSLRGWLEVAIQDFIRFFEAEHGVLGAIGKQSGEPKLIVRHNVGHGDHIHVQVSRLYAIRNPLSLPVA